MNEYSNKIYIRVADEMRELNLRLLDAIDCKDIEAEIKEITAIETKIDALKVWINERIKNASDIVLLFSPVTKTEKYTQNDFNAYVDGLKDFAFLVSMEELLSNKVITRKEFDNIEYAICKTYKTHFNDYLGAYV